MLNSIETELPGVSIFEPKVFRDRRGAFFESWNLQRYASHGVPSTFVQDNLSRSSYGVLRGLHLQHPNAQGKLVQVLVGSVWDVAVDLRRDSPYFGKWTAVTLSEENARQFWVPPGFHHGFCVTSEHAVFSYKCTDYYAPENEVSVAWNDPEIGIEWPIRDPVLSDKDKAAPTLAELAHERLPSVGDYAEG
jgi:dTDP-4-dehydrorhamnose 3,5-epimerase